MRHIHFVLFVLKSDFELKTVVVSAGLLFHLVLEVRNVFSVAVPTDVPVLCIISGVKQRLLTLVIRTIWFDEVDYLEFVADVSLHVRNFEEEPLSVRCRLVVVLKN